MALLVGSVLVSCALPSVAAERTAPPRWRFAVEGSAASYTIENPTPLPHWVGLGRVELDPSAPGGGRCEATGAGYLLAPQVEDGYVIDVLDQRQDPASEGSGGGYYNPTVARSVSPNPAHNPRIGSTKPALYSPDRPGARLAEMPRGSNFPGKWEARCVGRRSGQALGAASPMPGWLGLASGWTRAEYRPAGDLYFGFARGRAEAVSLPGALLDSVESTMTVRTAGGGEPRIDYALRVGRVEARGAHSRIAREGFTVAGTDVPASRLVAQFNEAVRGLGEAVAAFGPAGLALMPPAVRRAADGGLTVDAPTIAANAGSALREDDLGQQVLVALGVTSFAMRRVS